MPSKVSPYFYFETLRHLLRAIFARGERRVRARREMALHFLRGQAEMITFRRDEVEWTAFLYDMLTRTLFVEGAYHRRELAGTLAWLGRRGYFDEGRSTVIEVGANIGSICIPMAHQTGRHVVALEPVTETFAVLRRNVARNGLDDRITCRQAAVATRTGRIPMYASLDHGHSEVKTAGGVQGFGVPGAAHHLVEVEAITLDDLAAELGVPPGAVALVWSDTQGFESAVIESGAALWSANVPLFVEVWPQGLEAHGGIDRFVSAVRTHFRGMITDEALAAAGGDATPVAASEVVGLIREIGRRRRISSDVLLLP
jgi:FkbM family methyltransferase